MVLDDLGLSYHCDKGYLLLNAAGIRMEFRVFQVGSGKLRWVRVSCDRAGRSLKSMLDRRCSIFV